MNEHKLSTAELLEQAFEQQGVPDEKRLAEHYVLEMEGSVPYALPREILAHGTEHVYHNLGVYVPQSARVMPDVLLHYRVEIGENTKVDHGVVIGDGTVIGPESYIAPDCDIRDRVRAGRGFKMAFGSFVGRGALIGDDVHIGAKAEVSGNSRLMDDAVVRDNKKVKDGKVVHGKHKSDFLSLAFAR